MVYNYFLPLAVSLIAAQTRQRYDEKRKFPAHDKVLRVLLNNCINAFVYGVSKTSSIYSDNKGILISDKGKFKLDTTKECITNHEFLWNAHTWKRGSIVIILNIDALNWRSLFKNCYRPDLTASPNMGNTTSAVKKCKEEMKKGNIAVCLPASNGIDRIQIYAPQITIDRLFRWLKKTVNKPSGTIKTAYNIRFGANLAA